eukprot:573527-Hanusia_phi.AAC.1
MVGRREQERDQKQEEKGSREGGKEGAGASASHLLEGDSEHVCQHEGQGGDGESCCCDVEDGEGERDDPEEADDFETEEDGGGAEEAAEEGDDDDVAEAEDVSGEHEHDVVDGDGKGGDECHGEDQQRPHVPCPPHLLLHPPAQLVQILAEGVEEEGKHGSYSAHHHGALGQRPRHALD